MRTTYHLLAALVVLASTTQSCARTPMEPQLAKATVGVIELRATIKSDTLSVRLKNRSEAEVTVIIGEDCPLSLALIDGSGRVVWREQVARLCNDVGILVPIPADGEHSVERPTPQGLPEIDSGVTLVVEMQVDSKTVRIPVIFIE